MFHMVSDGRQKQHNQANTKTCMQPTHTMSSFLFSFFLRLVFFFFLLIHFCIVLVLDKSFAALPALCTSPTHLLHSRPVFFSSLLNFMSRGSHAE